MLPCSHFTEDGGDQMTDVAEALNQDHGQVPPDLLELYEVLEYKRLTDKKTNGRALSAPLAVVTEGKIITRDAWGARPPKSTSTSINPAAGGIAWHYEGPHMGIFPHSSCATKVRGIQAFHMDTRKWADIAYTGMYCPHGYIFVGRWWNRRTAAQGTNDGNDRYYAACFLGGVDDPFSVEAREAALLFRQTATRDGKAGPDNQPHSHFHSTGCPGDSIRAWLASGMPDPNSSPNPNPQPSLEELLMEKFFTIFWGDAPGPADDTKGRWAWWPAINRKTFIDADAAPGFFNNPNHCGTLKFRQAEVEGIKDLAG